MRKFNRRICHTCSYLRQERRSRHLFLRWYKVKKGTSSTGELQSNTSYSCTFLWLISPPTSSTELTVFTLSISLQLSSAFKSCFIFLMLKISWRLKQTNKHGKQQLWRLHFSSVVLIWVLCDMPARMTQSYQNWVSSELAVLRLFTM